MKINRKIGPNFKFLLETTLLALGGLIVLGAALIRAEIYEYDELNRLKKIIYDSGAYIEYEYDAAGNVVNVLSPCPGRLILDDQTIAGGVYAAGSEVVAGPNLTSDGSSGVVRLVASDRIVVNNNVEIVGEFVAELGSCS